MAEHAYYSVISPEGCATILWKGAEHAARAAEALKLTARDLKRVNSHLIEGAAYPVLTAKGALLPTRLRSAARRP